MSKEQQDAIQYIINGLLTHRLGEKDTITGRVMSQLSVKETEYNQSLNALTDTNIALTAKNQEFQRELTDAISTQKTQLEDKCAAEKDKLLTVHEAAIDTLNAKHKVAIEQIEAQNLALTSEKKSIETKLQTQIAETDILKTQIEDFSKKNTDDQIAALTEQIQKLNISFEEQTKKIITIEDDKTKLQTLTDALKKQLDDQNTELVAQIAVLLNSYFAKSEKSIKWTYNGNTSAKDAKDALDNLQTELKGLALVIFKDTNIQFNTGTLLPTIPVNLTVRIEESIKDKTAVLEAQIKKLEAEIAAAKFALGAEQTGPEPLADSIKLIRDKLAPLVPPDKVKTPSITDLVGLIQAQCAKQDKPIDTNLLTELENSLGIGTQEDNSDEQPRIEAIKSAIEQIRAPAQAQAQAQSTNTETPVQPQSQPPDPTFNEVKNVLLSLMSDSVVNATDSVIGIPLSLEGGTNTTFGDFVKYVNNLKSNATAVVSNNDVDETEKLLEIWMQYFGNGEKDTEPGTLTTNLIELAKELGSTNNNGKKTLMQLVQELKTNFIDENGEESTATLSDLIKAKCKQTETPSSQPVESENHGATEQPEINSSTDLTVFGFVNKPIKPNTLREVALELGIVVGDENLDDKLVLDQILKKILELKTVLTPNEPLQESEPEPQGQGPQGQEQEQEQEQEQGQEQEQEQEQLLQPQPPKKQPQTLTLADLINRQHNGSENGNLIRQNSVSNLVSEPDAKYTALVNQLLDLMNEGVESSEDTEETDQMSMSSDSTSSTKVKSFTIEEFKEWVKSKQCPEAPAGDTETWYAWSGRMSVEGLNKMKEAALATGGFIYAIPGAIANGYVEVTTFVSKNIPETNFNQFTNRISEDKGIATSISNGVFSGLKNIGTYLFSTKPEPKPERLTKSEFITKIETQISNFLNQSDDLKLKNVLINGMKQIISTPYVNYSQCIEIITTITSMLKNNVDLYAKCNTSYNILETAHDTLVPDYDALKTKQAEILKNTETLTKEKADLAKKTAELEARNANVESAYTQLQAEKPRLCEGESAIVIADGIVYTGNAEKITATFRDGNPRSVKIENSIIKIDDIPVQKETELRQLLGDETIELDKYKQTMGDVQSHFQTAKAGSITTVESSKPE